MELRSEISASMESKTRLPQAQKPGKTPQIGEKQPSMSQTNTPRKDYKTTAMREKGVKQFSPHCLFYRVKMLKTAKIFIEFRPAEIGDETPPYGNTRPVLFSIDCAHHHILLCRWQNDIFNRATRLRLLSRTEKKTLYCRTPFMPVSSETRASKNPCLDCCNQSELPIGRNRHHDAQPECPPGTLPRDVTNYRSR